LSILSPVLSESRGGCRDIGLRTIKQDGVAIFEMVSRA